MSRLVTIITTIQQEVTMIIIPTQVRARAAHAARMAVTKMRAGTKTPDAGSSKAEPGFAVGGCGGGCGNGKPDPTPGSDGMCRIGGPPQPVGMAAGCYHYYARKKNCSETLVGAQVTAVAGQTAFQLRVQPIRGTYFLPTRAEMLAVDNADIDLDGRVWITAVTINGTAQECFDDTAPTAGSLNGVWDDLYQSRNQGSVTGVPVRWGPFGKTTLNQELIIAGFNRNVALDLRDISVAVWGYCVASLPTEWQCGQYPGDESKPTF